MNKRFLIGQLGHYGDCLYATTVAKQIKADNPGCYLTWAIASKYRSILFLNPDVDEIWEVENGDWNFFESELKKRLAKGIYDQIFITQLAIHWDNYDGTIRSSTYNGYGKPITVSVDPVIYLSETEIDHVNTFAASNKLSTYKHIILFECAPTSGQSHVNTQFALNVAEFITGRYNDACFILSSPTKVVTQNTNIIDASTLSFRENAELVNHCTLLIGCSSGITWLSTSSWSKDIDTLQLLKRDGTLYTGLKYDFTYWHKPTSNIIELTNSNFDYTINCIETIFKKGFSDAKINFDEDFKPGYNNFRPVVASIMWGNSKNKIKSLAKTINKHMDRNLHFNRVKLISIAIYGFCKYYLLITLNRESKLTDTK